MEIFTRTKRLLRIYLFTAVIALIAFTGVTGSAQEEKGKKGLQVTLLLYSGRPNPTYILEDKESIVKFKQLIGKTKAHEKFEKTTVIPSVLGYNGIMVENLGMTVEQFPASMNIYKGNVEVKDDRKKFMRDEGNEIEDFLLNKAMERKVIDEKTIRKIKAAK
jgi:hypothetical protein